MNPEFQPGPMRYENTVIPHSDIPRHAEVRLQPVERSYMSVQYISWSILYGLLGAVLAALFWLVDDLQRWWVAVPTVLALTSFAAFTVAGIRIGFRNRAWALREKDIVYRKGWLFQSTHVIPFVKIQHCVVRSGPIERRFGLSSIRLLTAAGHDMDIGISGLRTETAERLKEWIMEKTTAYARAGV